MNNKKSKLNRILSLGKPLEQWLQNSIIDVGDYFFTFVRLFQVFSNVMTNAIHIRPNKDLETASGKDINAKKAHGLPPSDDETGGHSRYDHTVHNSHGGLTPAGDAIFVSMGFSMLLGAIRGIYQKIHATKNISTERLRKNLMNTAATDKAKETIANMALPDTVDQVYPNNNRYKIVARRTRISRLHRLKVIHANVDDTLTEDDLIEAAKQAQASKQTRLTPINQVSDSAVGRVTGSLWNFGVNQSMIYWLAWYMRVVLTNMKESMSRFSAKITVGVTAITGLTFSLWKVLNMSYRSWKKTITIGHISQLMVNPARTDLPLSPTEKQNLLNVIAFVGMDDNLKDPHQLDKTQLAHRKAKIQAALTLYKTALAKDKAKRKHMRETWIQAQFMEQEASQNAARLHLAEKPRTEHLLTEQETNNPDITNLHLRQHLLLDNNPLLNRRTVVATIRNVVIGFALPFFIFSLLAAATVLFPQVPLVLFAAGILKSALIMTAVGVVIGGIMGLVTPAAERRNTHLHRAKAEAALNETVTVNDVTITKETQFSLLESRLKSVMAKIRGDNNLLTKIRDSGYAFDRINVYNDDYFEKQRTAPTGWARAKKVMKRAYEFVGGGQTGVLITRFLFLGGMVAAPLVAGLTVATFGAPLIFFGIASVLAVTLGGLRLAHYRQNRAVAHSNHGVSHLDARIKYLENRTAELEAFVAKQDNHSDNDLSQDQDGLNGAQTKLAQKDDLTENNEATSSLTTASASSITEASSSASTSTQDELKQYQPPTTVMHYEEVPVKPAVMLSSSQCALFGKPSTRIEMPALETRDLPYAARMA